MVAMDTYTGLRISRSLPPLAASPPHLKELATTATSTSHGDWCVARALLAIGPPYLASGAHKTFHQQPTSTWSSHVHGAAPGLHAPVPHVAPPITSGWPPLVAASHRHQPVSFTLRRRPSPRVGDLHLSWSLPSPPSSASAASHRHRRKLQDLLALIPIVGAASRSSYLHLLPLISQHSTSLSLTNYLSASFSRTHAHTLKEKHYLLCREALPLGQNMLHCFFHRCLSH
jgi:hypothetical protein